MIFQIQKELFALSEQMDKLKNNGFIGNVTGAGAGEMEKKKQEVSASSQALLKNVFINFL